MPSVLRSRLALTALLGLFLIPIAANTLVLRGLTHILTCTEETTTPFRVDVGADDAPESATLGSALSLERGDEGTEPDAGAGLPVCDGLVLNLGVTPPDGHEVGVRIPITNTTDDVWRGSVTLKVDDINLPVDVGEIAPGATAEDEVRITLGDGVHELRGELLIGP